MSHESRKAAAGASTAEQGAIAATGRILGKCHDAVRTIHGKLRPGVQVLRLCWVHLNRTGAREREQRTGPHGDDVQEILRRADLRGRVSKEVGKTVVLGDRAWHPIAERRWKTR